MIPLPDCCSALRRISERIRTNAEKEQRHKSRPTAQQRIFSCAPSFVVDSDANQWRVALVDVSTIQALQSMTENPLFAQNAVSYSSETGGSFAKEQPRNARIFNLEEPLRYRRDQPLAEALSLLLTVWRTSGPYLWLPTGFGWFAAGEEKCMSLATASV